ncbi:hypothetical protein DLAC_10302 [Tieghemostelium lacteum]|uniref:rRNA-processing protein FYV7 n=1 Tax=Tieghemostelium lacteum TaxID=361077 RepID=A0A151Z5J9_TIELA|nr:hypothetical protein DLAC_10302 [Tieghemostelium lacteum]|eukprot:KYQ89074.1 hypothetical protein DLAC_10302 [Tieghemostelium lacteum]
MSAPLNNRQKKELFKKRGLVSTKKSDNSTLSIDRFSKAKNTVYVNKEKIEAKKKENKIQFQYKKNREKHVKTEDIYEKLQKDDPLSRFGLGESSTYDQTLKEENKNKNNRIRGDKKRKKMDDNNSSTNNNIDNEQEDVDEDEVDNSSSKKKLKLDSNNKKDKDEVEKDVNKKEDTEEIKIKGGSATERFKQARAEYIKMKAEKEARIKEAAVKKAESEAKQAAKKKEKKFLQKRTSKGQPIMKNLMNNLLKKIQE